MVLTTIVQHLRQYSSDWINFVIILSFYMLYLTCKIKIFHFNNLPNAQFFKLFLISSLMPVDITIGIIILPDLARGLYRDRCLNCIDLDYTVLLWVSI